MSLKPLLRLLTKAITHKNKFHLWCQLSYHWQKLGSFIQNRKFVFYFKLSSAIAVFFFPFWNNFLWICFILYQSPCVLVRMCVCAYVCVCVCVCVFKGLLLEAVKELLHAWGTPKTTCQHTMFWENKTPCNILCAVSSALNSFKDFFYTGVVSVSWRLDS